MQSKFAGSLVQQILGISLAVFLASVAPRSAGADETPDAAAVPVGTAEELAPHEGQSGSDEASADSSSSQGESHGAAESPLLTIPEVAGFRINGRFDVYYELGGFSADGSGDPKSSIKNYHHFIFLSRNRQDEWFSLNVELIDQTFYEIGLKLSDRYQVRGGKIMVPFGADPLFHKSYGGVSGVDQELLPIVWAEHGAVFEANLYESDTFSIDNEAYVVSGIGGDADELLDLSRGSAPNTIAVGDRLRVGYGKFAGAASLYWSPYADDYNMLMWGFDLSAGYGFLPWRFIDRLGVKVGFMRADIQGSTASGLGDYYHSGNYLQLDYRLPCSMGVRYRTGMVTMENHDGFFFDDDRKDVDDAVAHSFSIWKSYRGLTVTAQYIINIEEAGELDNDVFRITAAFDF